MNASKRTRYAFVLVMIFPRSELRSITQIQLEIPDEYFKVVEEFARQQGMNPGAVLNSAIKSYAEWFIPAKSFDPVSAPKKMIGALFEMVSKESIDKLSEQWAIESRHIVLLSGTTFSTETAIDFTYKVSRYFMGADAKLIRSKEKSDVISFIIRHDGAEKFSYFCAQCFDRFYNFFSLKKVSINHDSSCVYVEVDLREDEMEAMKRYIDSIKNETQAASRE